MHVYREKAIARKRTELGRLFACPRRRRSERAAEARAKFVLVGREKIAVRDRKRDKKEGKKSTQPPSGKRRGITRGTGAGRVAGWGGARGGGNIIARQIESDDVGERKREVVIIAQTAS